MSRRNAMHRPPRLSQVDVAEYDDEAPTCSARESRVALAELGARRPAYRSSVSSIEDSDVISSAALREESVRQHAARPSYAARGEIGTGETRTFARAEPAQLLEEEPAFTLNYHPDADGFAKTEAIAAVDIEASVLGQTREEPLVAADQSFVDHTLMMPASTPAPSFRAPYRSQMMSVPPPADSWRESPWVMPSTVQPAMTPPAPRRDGSMLQTIGIIGTGIVMLAIVFGAVLFARNDGEERMQFTRAAAQQLPAPAVTPVQVALPAQPAMQVISAPAAAEAPKGRVIAASPAPVVAPEPARATVEPRVVKVAATPRAKEPVVKAVAVREAAPRPAKEPKAEGKKTKEEQEVESLLAKLGEEQLR